MLNFCPQTFFSKPELTDHISTWKTTQCLYPFAFWFCLQIVAFSKWGKLSAKTHVDCIQLTSHRTHWQVAGGNASCSLSNQVFNRLSQGKRLCYRLCSSYLPLQCLVCCMNQGSSQRVSCTRNGFQCFTQCLQKMTWFHALKITCFHNVVALITETRRKDF